MAKQVVKVIDDDGEQVDFDPEAVGFPKKWEVALAFTKKVFQELEDKPDELAVPDFIIKLIDRCP